MSAEQVARAGFLLFSFIKATPSVHKSQIGQHFLSHVSSAGGLAALQPSGDLVRSTLCPSAFQSASPGPSALAAEE